MKKQLFNQMEQSEATFAKMVKEIWDNPQIGYEETFAFELQKNFLAEQGFRITTGSGDIATAFVAEWGTGAPIIGF